MAAITMIAAALLPVGAGAQTITIHSLVARAVAVNPRLRAAQHRVDAARARIGPAGARPDPRLMAGIQNFPITSERTSAPSGHGSPVTTRGGPDPMTMRMIGVEQTLPYPGKLSLGRRSAEREVDAARADVDAARLEVGRDVRRAYYDIAYADRALQIIERSRLVLLDVIKAAEVRYSVGNGAQPDVLRARVEAARLGEEAVALLEDRRAALAALNVLLDLPADTPLDSTLIPERIARAAVSDSAAKIRFESGSLGSRAADSPLPPLGALQSRAVERSPVLRAHEAMIAAQTASVELARYEQLPDFDVSLQYGQRPGLPDMITAILSLPIPIQRRSKQNQLLAEARDELSALGAEHHALLNEIRGDVARLYAELERDRAQLALYVKAIIPQGRATLESAVANYQVARSDFLSLLDAQTTLFNYETAYFRTLTSFAKTLAELEQVVGEEILR
ncbi:MAG TPA: TolC family protein [Gemmatimonadaceae bacterium]|nr:TolC family protein [Gemmatimonadaceae bacterium]